jgi:hypothetical protein
VTLRVVHLGLVPDHLLRVRRRLVGLSRCALPPIVNQAGDAYSLALIVIQPATIPLTVLFHILILT